MSAMRPWAGTESRALPALLAAVVVAIVLGILGMHALNMHGTIGGSMDSMPGMTGMSSTSATSHEALANPAADTAVASALDAPGHDMGGMVMLCVAMLAAAGIALLALLLRRAPRSNWLSTRPRATAAILRGLIATRTGTGPPSVWAFSVIRC